MYIAAGQGQTTPGTKVWCQQKPLVTSVICYMFQQNLFEIWFYTFFHDFINVYCQWQEWQPFGDEMLMSTGTSCHFGHLFASFKNHVFEVWFYIFFYDLIHVFSPGAGADRPQETKFWWQVSKKYLWSLISYIFFHDLIHVYSPRAGSIQPPGDNVLMSTETSCHCGHLLLVSNHRWR